MNDGYRDPGICPRGLLHCFWASGRAENIDGPDSSHVLSGLSSDNTFCMSGERVVVTVLARAGRGLKRRSREGVVEFRRSVKEIDCGFTTPRLHRSRIALGVPSHLDSSWLNVHILIRPLTFHETGVAIHQSIRIQAGAVHDIVREALLPDLDLLRRDIAVLVASSGSSMTVDDLGKDADAAEVAGGVTAHVLDAKIDSRVPR